MNRSKKIFVIVSVLFVVVSVIVAVDMFSRTTRRGAKKHLPTAIAPEKAK